MKDAKGISIQAKVVDFALAELVRQHRESFQPLWTVDSWVKFLIWIALNCGLPGERESLELFANSLGSRMISRMRRLFFERTLENLEIKIMADPAERQVLLMPLAGQTSISSKDAVQALEEVALADQILMDTSRWQYLDAVLVIPWKVSETES